jgi:hypothetical protein
MLFPIEEFIRLTEQSKTNSAQLYWIVAPHGETALILGDWDQARAHYEKALQIAGKSWGDLRDSFRQARIVPCRS